MAVGRDQKYLWFQNGWIAAPMIKASLLPFRLLCLNYGADIVFTEELMACRLAEAQYCATSNMRCDFVCRDDLMPLFSTCPAEQNRVVVQLGATEGVTATKAALLVERHAIGIDINMGCPKSFSVKHGMGAALLQSPDRAADILKTVKRNIAPTTTLTCKIRLLDTLDRTVDFARLCEHCGVDAVILHARHVSDRPAHPAQWNAFQTVQSALSIPVVCNGDLTNPHAIAAFFEQHGPMGPGSTTRGGDAPVFPPIMLARGALWNPSIFRLKHHFIQAWGASRDSLDYLPETPKTRWVDALKEFSLQPGKSCVQDIIQNAIVTETSHVALKWLLGEMLTNMALSRLAVSVKKARVDTYGGRV